MMPDTYAEQRQNGEQEQMIHANAASMNAIYIFRGGRQNHAGMITHAAIQSACEGES
jgi:hypothetical protein